MSLGLSLACGKQTGAYLAEDHVEGQQGRNAEADEGHEDQLVPAWQAVLDGCQLTVCKTRSVQVSPVLGPFLEPEACACVRHGASETAGLPLRMRSHAFVGASLPGQHQEAALSCCACFCPVLWPQDVKNPILISPYRAHPAIVHCRASAAARCKRARLCVCVSLLSSAACVPCALSRDAAKTLLAVVHAGGPV